MKSNQEIAQEVIAGKWGNGQERRTRLTEAGYDYNAVQTIVNSLLKDGYTVSRETNPEPVADPAILEINYDPKQHKGIQINIIVG